MMEKDPALQKELDNYGAYLRRRSFASKICMMDLTILLCALLICGTYLEVRTTYKHKPSAIDNKRDFAVVEEYLEYGILLFMAFSTLAVFGTLHFIYAREMFYKDPKTDVNKIYKTLGLCKFSSMVLILLGLAGVLIGYPDIKLCAFLILFETISLVMFLMINVIEPIYEAEVLINLEKRIVEEGIPKFVVFLLRKTESV